VPTYVALLRGINVSSKRLAMADLRAAYESIGLTDVRTLLNSGNVVFGSSTTVSPSDLEQAVRSRTGIDSRTIVVPATRFRAIADAVPYRDQPDHSRVIVTFFETVPTSVDVPDDLAPELISLGEDAMYQWLPDGVLKSKLPASFATSLGLATARNLRTIDKLVALLS
jgi:uncharacterized protein (DUF1697 family)